MTQKLALITGGLHRVGAAISARLAREGYALAIHKRSPGEADPVLAEALAETGARSHRFAADLSDPAAVDALIPAVADQFGRAPGLLVNNAALFAEGEWAELSATAGISLSTAAGSARSAAKRWLIAPVSASASASTGSASPGLRLCSASS